ncbi:MAG: response regulator [Planctomycetota bacterium]
MEKQNEKIRLLLVDDEEGFLATMSKVLERRNIDVFIACGGKEAFEILRKQEMDVVVLDMKMPGMDGAEVFDVLKRLRPNLPVIILTGHESLSDACEMIREGAFYYLVKPCDSDLLVKKIREAVEERGGQAATGEEGGSVSNDVETVRVLLVDDERELLETLKKVLTRRAMEVFTAENGDEALALLEETPVDVVVLDIKMPGMDGLDLLRRIKAGSVNREVILLTGHPTVTTALTGTKQGAFEYLMKPPDMEELTRLIRKAYHLRKEKIAKEQHKTIEEILRRFPD